MKIEKLTCINDLIKNNEISQKDLLNKFILMGHLCEEEIEIHTILYVFSLGRTFEFKVSSKREYYCYNNIVNTLKWFADFEFIYTI